MEGHCLVISGDWRCSDSRKWEFVIDTKYMSRVVAFREGMGLNELKENVLTEFFGNMGFGRSLSLSYWPPNSSELAIGITTSPVMVNNTGAIVYFCKHFRIKEGLNLFVSFGMDGEAGSGTKTVDKGEGYTPPAARGKRKCVFKESRTPLRDVPISSIYGGYGSSAGSKSCPLEVDDEEILSHVEMTEERFRRERSATEDGDRTTEVFEYESNDKEQRMDDDVNVLPMVYDNEFWEPLIDDGDGGSNAVEFICPLVEEVNAVGPDRRRLYSARLIAHSTTVC
ncbi:unnamed protein product [Thlaspi arvense]|uniref:Uncharacterized protein n=1 Tax=Thlaspi arvense TaxID=13288 RepID=A0AAU9RV86_THLAR|nr:unnamed protein product [Thlaspi arvense]